MLNIERRYDIDWLRVIAIGFLLIYHIAIGFQPWGLMIGFIQSEEPLEALWVPMAMLNVWRIPLLFFVSGMGVYFAMRKRNWKQLIVERAKRILLPFTFGMLVIVPIHVLIIINYYGQPFQYLPSAGHLWFLGNIFAYVVLLSPLFYYLKKHSDTAIGQRVKRVFGSPIGLLIIIASIVGEVLIVKPAPFEMYASTWHGFYIGFLAFMFGYLCVYSGKEFWQLILKLRWFTLVGGLTLYLLRISEFNFNAPGYLSAIESNLWIFAAFGFAYRHFNHSSKALSYLSQAAYPIYIIHMFVLYGASYLIFPMALPIILQFILVVMITTGGCFIIYELFIRRIRMLRPLFGLKN